MSRINLPAGVLYLFYRKALFTSGSFTIMVTHHYGIIATIMLAADEAELRFAVENNDPLQLPRDRGCRVLMSF